MSSNNYMEWIKREYRKISDAFDRVKKDIISIKRDANSNKKEILELKKQVNELKLLVAENKTKIIEKEVGKRREIIGNIDSKKYHYDDCPFGKKIKEDNKIVFSSIEEAVKKGYDECMCINES